MTDPLAALAPRRVLEHGLLASGGAWTEAATTLFVDLEGFTPLTERLGRLGSRGTEELSALLRGLFEGVTDLVTAAGGDPVAFGGDALTVLFDGPAPAALEAATSAGAAVDRLTGEVAGESGAAGHLRTRIGIARGEVTTGIARSGRRCLPVQLGPGLDRAVAAQATARPGTVAVHPSARVDRPEPAGQLTEPAGAVSPAGLAELASPWVVDGLTGGSAPWESHRRVTTAFARFPAVPAHDVDAFLSTAGRLLALVDDTEGEVVQVSGGDKGVVAMVVFGAPLAHADDAGRAVDTMLRLREAVPDVGCGIASGPVFAALLGSRTRAFLTHTGLAVTTAARLMQHAGPGELLVDDATWGENAGRLRPHAGPTRRLLKGHRDRVTVHAVAGARGSAPAPPATSLPRLVGRDRETRAAEALLDAAARGLGHALVVHGEPGIGKTRLAQEAVDRARTRGFRVATLPVDGRPDGRSQARWRTLVATLLDLPDDATTAQWEAGVSARLPATPDAARRLGPLLGLPPGPPPEPTPPPDQALEGELARGLLVQLLTTVSRDHPLLVVVDDADRADAVTRELLTTVADGIRGTSTALLVTAAGPTPVLGDALALGELAPAEVALLAADVWRLLGAGSPPPWLGAEVVGRAGGNPLYVRTVVWALHDEWQPGSPTPVAGPPSGTSLTGLLHERVDRLPGDGRELVHLLAAVRRPCAPELLAGVSGVLPDVAAVRRVVGSPAVARLVETTGGRGGEHYRLAHDVLRRAVHDSLSHAERDRLHRRLAQVLEQHGADPREIAEHALERHDPHLQRAWLPRAAEAARRAWNFPEAQRHLERVLPLLAGEAREQAEVELLEVMLVAGRADEVLARAKEPGAQVPGPLAGRRLQVLAEAAFVGGDFARCQRAAGAAMALSDGEDEERHQRTGELLVLAMAETGAGREAVATAEGLLARAVTARDPRATTRARAALGAALLLAGRPDQAAPHYEEALAGARDAGDVVVQVHVLSDLAGCAFETGDHAACTRLLSEARSLADGIGYRRHLAFNLNNDAQLRASLGDPHAARCAATAVARSVELGDLGGAANALHTWLTTSPELAASVAHWRRLSRLDADLGRTLAAAGDDATLAVVAARGGDPQEARRAAAAAAAAAADQPRLLRRLRLGRLLAATPSGATDHAQLLHGLDDLAADADVEEVERAELAVERWRVSHDAADHRAAVHHATAAFAVEPSAVVGAWFDELGAPAPRRPQRLPPPVGIGSGGTTLAELDEAFGLVEERLRARRQRSE